MSLRTVLRRAFHLADRLLLARLPMRWQRRIVATLLTLARYVRPNTNWPASADALLIRRVIKTPPKSMRRLPDWAVTDLQELAQQVDPLLNLETFLASDPQARYAPTHWTEAGQAYQRICKQIAPFQCDTILLVPWLKRGGADLAALHHARLCHTDFDQRTLVIATEVGDSPWAERLPEGVRFIAIGQMLSGLSTATHEREIVLARLLLQLAPKRVHIINSHLGWRTLERFGRAISQDSRIFASLYCDELTADGRPDGLAQRYLPTASPWLTAVISDNTASPASWTASIGIAPELFHVVHFPAPASQAQQPSASTNGRLLWASRLERQKRPDLLVALATQLSQFHWDVYGSSLSNDDPHWISLSRLPNVALHGSYERFSDIVRPDHLAYIYTTAWDGLPNVLLEAASMQLPIIAPDIGGIHDLIPRHFLLPEFSNTEHYIRAIVAMTDPENRKRYLELQNKRLERFTWQNFADDMRRIASYIVK